MIYGHFFLILQIVLLLILVSTYYISTYYNSHVPIARTIYTYSISINFILGTVVLLCLMHMHVMSDFSVRNVSVNSHTMQPIVYKIAGLWGNHEGSMYLFTWILNTYLYSTVFLRKVTSNMYGILIHTYILISLFFTLYILNTSSPFIQTSNITLEGTELSPVLQDIVLAIHPPILFFGYIGLSFAMCLAIAAIKTKYHFKNQWIYYTQQYSIISWCFLTTGIMLGSWWAYYELGWGGWWFWDPVENVSLMPWIICTALIHSIRCTQKTGYLIGWSTMLAIYCFYSTIVSTSFVRSGLMDSVHSFSVDAHRSYYLCLLALIFLCYFCYLVYAYNKHSPVTQQIRSLFSYEGTVLLNQGFLIYLYIMILVGTFYPVVHQLVFTTSITIGPSFFNKTLLTILVPFFTYLNFATFFFWTKKHVLVKVVQIHIAVLSLFIGIVCYIFINNTQIPLLLCIFLLLLVQYIIYVCIRRYTDKHNITNTAIVVHLGLYITTLSMLVWYVYNKIMHFVLLPGDVVIYNKYAFVFKGINYIKGLNYNAFFGVYDVFKRNILVSSMYPEKRHYIIQDIHTSKTEIKTTLFNDIHIVLGDGNIYSGWETTINIYPSVIYIWTSIIIMCIFVLHTQYHRIRLYNKKIHI